MTTSIWITVAIFATIWSWCIWEIWTAPIMPDDYGAIKYNKTTKTKTKK